MPVLKQLTPETAPELVNALQQLGKRGTVKVSQVSRAAKLGVKGIGRLTCEVVAPNGKGQMLLYRVEGLGLYVSITADGFEPQKPGEYKALFEITPRKICITEYNHKHQPIWTHFELM